jgi:hypothetical protein
MGGDMYSSTNSFNKSICRSENCNAILIFDSTIQDQNGKYIPLDLNHKRHFCCSSDKILHECSTVERLQKLVEDANHTELSSFELELRIVDGVNK